MTFFSPVSRRRARSAATGAALLLTLAACGASTTSSAPTGAKPSTAGMHGGMDGMAGMGAMAGGDGLAATSNGYALTTATSSLPADRPTGFRFTVTGPDGRPVTGFTVDQTKALHFYAIRSDLTGFQHVHPTMAADGGWTAPLAALTPGNWRLFATFTPATGPGKGSDFVLSRTVTVPGAARTTPLPSAAAITRVDGYTVTVSGKLTAGTASPLTAVFSRDSKPVTDLEPYLDAYAHLTAFRAGDQAFAHLHPAAPVTGGHGGPALAFEADLPAPGEWRLFLQFRSGGALHTAPLTLHVS